MTMFTNATKNQIKGGNFTNVTGDVHFNDYISEGHVTAKLTLSQKIVETAFHDSADRDDPPPRCYEGTRKAVLAEIKAWLKSLEAREKFLLWMDGPAGAGKTAIAQSIAEACAQEGLLAASFFFSRSAAGRNNTSKFIATLSYQLSRCIPEMREPLFAAIEEDATIFHRSLATQMQVLVINPIKEAQPTFRTETTRFVVMDGIDECGPDGRTPAELIAVLGTAVSELKHLPLIFLITSREEYEIKQAFKETPLAMLTKRMTLDHKYKPNDDIKLYLNSRFQQIVKKQLDINDHFSSQWPLTADVDHLVQKSSGQFIFAAIVMKFIEPPRHDPTERLKIILGLSAMGDKTPFAHLDALYRHILSSVPDSHFEMVKSILTVLTLTTNYRNALLSMNMVEDLLGSGVHFALLDMHALIFVPPHKDKGSFIRLHHASMYDFLLDQSRSQKYFIDAGEGNITLTRQWIKAIGNYSRSLSRKHDSASIQILVKAFQTHCQRIPASNEVASDLAELDLRAVLDEIASGEEILGIFASDWVGFLKCAKQQRNDRVDVYPRLRNEIDVFFLHRLSQYPHRLHSHIPVLFSFGNLQHSEDVFEILLYAGHPTMAELEHLRKTDIGLLNLQNLSNAVTPFWGSFFKDKTRAGKYYLDGKNYAALAKEIIELIFPGSYEDARQVRLVGKRGSNNNNVEAQHSIDESDANVYISLRDVNMPYFGYILSKASQDSNLAQLLEGRFCQHRSYRITDQLGDDQLLRDLRDYSERYLQRCGIWPYTDRGDMHVFGGNSIVEPPSDSGSNPQGDSTIEPSSNSGSNSGHASESHALHRPPSI